MKSTKVALVKGSNRRDNIRRAMELIREDVVSEINCQEVIVKPNCLQSAVPLSCTHVDALRGILDFLSHLSPESVVVAEGCGDSDHFESFRRLGYVSLPEEYDTSLTDLQEEDNWMEIHLLSRDCQQVKARISRTMVDCKCRISAAVAKTHDTVVMTASWKNMMGALAARDKVKMHGCNSHRERILTSEVVILPQNLIRLAKLIPPHIGVIDAFIGMEGDGPVRGDEKYLGIAIASTDFVAADAVCAKAMGFEPMGISYLYYGHQLGLGTAALDDIRIVGDSIGDVAGKFVPHSNYPTQRLWRELAAVESEGIAR
jgi:uncharacterized protein (DUF362 family)